MKERVVQFFNRHGITFAMVVLFAAVCVRYVLVLALMLCFLHRFIFRTPVPGFGAQRRPPTKCTKKRSGFGRTSFICPEKWYNRKS